MNPSSAAEFLFALRSSAGEADGLPLELVPRSLEDAYREQASLIDKIIARDGGRRIGYKIACSNALAQRLLNVDAPLFGTLLSSSTHASPAVLSASGFRLRCIEPEFGVAIAQDVPVSRSAYDAASVRPYVASVFPSLEVVDHHFSDWGSAGAPTLVADNAIHGAWVEGATSADWRTVDLAAQAVSLSVNGKCVRTGSGAEVLGNPLNAVAWLANELPRHGLRLRAGDRISTGTATDIYLAAAGDTLEADFGVLGRVQLRFT